MADDGALKGVKDLANKLALLGKLEDGKAVRAAVRAGGKVVVDQAKVNIPVGSVPHKTYKGRLVQPGFAKSAVRMITKLNSNKQIASAHIGVRKEAFYAVQFVERGTSKMRANPWLRTAMSSTQTQQKEAVKAALAKAVAKASKGVAG